MNERQGIREVLKHIGLKTLAVSVSLLVLIIGIAVFAGIRIHSIEKQIMVQKGELIAKEAAAEYNRYLITREGFMLRTGYQVDKLLDSGANTSVIEKYLTEETEFILSRLGSETTGLYGWISGKYLDGAGWVPDEDYVPTERPWYVQTIESEMEITLVEPYLDVHTGNVILTITKKLNGGENIIALDVNLDLIQKIVQQIASTTEGTQAFVMDSKGVVVAHSDNKQLGKNYLEEKNSLGHAVAVKMLNGRDRQFELDTEYGDYSVYVDSLEGGWFSVSLINSAVWHRPIHRAMLIFSLIMIFVLAMIIMVFLHIASKNLALEKLNSQIDLEEKRSDALQALSETDRMTGLNDRVSGRTKIDSLATPGMFLELDIDNFKSINDTFGHQTGDLVILAVAEAMKSTFRSNDITMRLGGDEFGVYAVGIGDNDLGEVIIRRFFNKIDKIDIPELEGRKVSLSIGAAICTEPEPFDSLYSRADEALYLSKKQTGNYVTFSRTEARKL